jgi:hypothetical protein
MEESLRGRSSGRVPRQAKSRENRATRIPGGTGLRAVFSMLPEGYWGLTVIL